MGAPALPPASPGGAKAHVLLERLLPHELLEDRAG
eukprot:CAMPEP_0182899986 /NCGR_PEP_ID=MMETSP0034_2-20130328/28472_1 /TAXON_ID=156128 /ORGANISM="Nephroselmis pyriformis, Strain CCMP717" /LENGTH=34 /DNA_ID= /DNA_START= /DNA_END= /DNA_ORIENTATION=